MHRASKHWLILVFLCPGPKDNRPLKFEEFKARIGNTIFVSATPGKYEHEHATNIVEQIIRPTGLVDPMIEVKPILEHGDYHGQVPGSYSGI